MYSIKNIWTYARWVVYPAIVVIIGAWVFQSATTFSAEETAKAVAYIQETKLTMPDVDGSNIPPPVNQASADSTIEGIDANNNGIRDDVEREVFTRYPNDIQTRAAMLQYALVQQLYFTHVFNRETLDAVNLQDSRATFCVWGLVPKPWSDDVDIMTLSDEELWELQELDTAHIEEQRALSDEIHNIVRNTEGRKGKIEELFKQYYKGSSSGKKPYCDIDFS